MSRINSILAAFSLVTSASLLALTPTAADAVSHSSALCAGRTPTIVVDAHSSHVVRGTGGADVVAIEDAGHVVLAGRGDDIVCGSAGADTVSGQGGADLVLAGAGGDHVSGGAGADEISGQAGSDHLSGGAGADRLTGGAGVDVQNGQAGNDLVIGATASDHLNGSAGNDDCVMDDGDVVLCDDADAQDVGVSVDTEIYISLARP